MNEVKKDIVNRLTKVRNIYDDAYFVETLQLVMQYYFLEPLEIGRPVRKYGKTVNQWLHKQQLPGYEDRERVLRHLGYRMGLTDVQPTPYPSIDLYTFFKEHDHA